MGKKKVSPVLCDTNILFDFLDGNETIRKNLKKIGEDRIAFSVIAHAEAFCGSNKVEFAALKVFFNHHITYHLSEESSKIFNGLVQSHYGQRHSKWIPDALIASIALSNNLELYTLNRKDFDFIPGLKLYKP